CGHEPRSEQRRDRWRRRAGEGCRTAVTVVLLSFPDAGIPPAAVPFLRSAHAVFASGIDSELADLLGAKPAPEDLTAEAGPVVLIATDASDPAVEQLVRAGSRVIAQPSGAGLVEAAPVVDRLRSPAGCPWDADQTHESLRQYL